MPQIVKWKCNLCVCLNCDAHFLLGQRCGCERMRPRIIDCVTLTKQKQTVEEEKRQLIQRLNSEVEY